MHATRPAQLLQTPASSAPGMPSKPVALRCVGACRQLEDELDQRTSQLIVLRKAAVEQACHAFELACKPLCLQALYAEPQSDA